MKCKDCALQRDCQLIAKFNGKALDLEKTRQCRYYTDAMRDGMQNPKTTTRRDGILE